MMDIKRPSRPLTELTMFSLACICQWNSDLFAQSNRSPPVQELVSPQRSTDILPSPSDDRRLLDLRAASWMTVPPPPVRTFKTHDIISIRVDEIARVRADGASQSRKNGLYDTILRDWIHLDGIGVRPDPQSDGDPRIRTSLNQLNRTNASLESHESLSLNIAAEVVDIRPNGSLVLEAHKAIWINENAWDTSLTGICRSQDIGPDNVILTRDILDLQINKKERGQLRDGYRRGWFTKLFETFQPF